MYQFAATPQTSTEKLPVFFQNFQKTVQWLKVNESKISTENAFNRDYFRNGANIESNDDPILDASSNLQTPEDIRRTFFNRTVVLASFEPVAVVFGPWE